MIVYCYILFILGLISGFLFDKLPIKSIAIKIARQSIASITLMKSKEISDEKKQKLLLLASIEIFKDTLKIASLLCLIGLLIVFISITYNIFSPSESLSLLSFTATVKGISISILSVILYFILTKIHAHFRL